MNKRHGPFIILLIAAVIAGCVTAPGPSATEKTSLVPNEGVRDLSFLSPMEIEILEAVNEIRKTTPEAGPLAPLKTSRGLSLAARERALERARRDKVPLTKEEERDLLLGRVSKYGTASGSVAEIASYGYSGAAAVTELMKNGSAKDRPPLYFMDPKFTVAGIGCTQAGYPPPICVLTFAGGFEEAR